MTPAARTQAAIDLLDQIITAARAGGAAADTLIARYFASRRYAGSKDRRAVRELAYAAIRLCGEIPASGRAAMLALANTQVEIAGHFSGEGHGPAPVGAGEIPATIGTTPAWLGEALNASGIDEAERAALIARAPLDVRINRLRGDSVSIEGAGVVPGLPDALRLPSGTNVETLEAWQTGAIEVQDAGSQIVTSAAQALPGQHIVDLCAGAGGKTLALAAAMANTGEILATDSDRARLSRLAPRAQRAGVSIVTTRLLDPNREAEALTDWAERADCVLIDAPCSGTGTWRRNPEARWRLTPDRLARLVETQARLIDVGAALVKPGGALVYIVCSLLDGEGTAQAARFLAANPEWRAEPLKLPAGRTHGAGTRLTPAHDDTDGFFLARFVRMAAHRVLP
ncbi:RsmB/NOP family class I SAM-dependent RNA methyltransferase [Sphingomonas sp. GC_Shp_3]|uniref:RsmB/NOP family class I SAM-dependent RNA methyltransferase n=1 Tax=Sphingomonas sp. GC_Shp_3 TaxID=2937383 RepID=UPI0022697FEF|nr:RsmB/NOP family class I SAM-dependent RNA methyltransferase [Sphingomonas sp. GC_Shp_3]